MNALRLIGSSLAKVFDHIYEEMAIFNNDTIIDGSKWSVEWTSHTFVQHKCRQVSVQFERGRASDERCGVSFGQRANRAQSERDGAKGRHSARDQRAHVSERCKY